MMPAKLAILGGEPTIRVSFQKYNSIGVEEVDAARRVVESGILSGFVASSGDEFYGGSKVIEFEERCRTYFEVDYSVTVNSWTSGLIASVGAIGIEPGDEVIVTPWTMSATASAILHWNAIPVFSDIEEETFNLDPDVVEEHISPYTKAIMIADIFGHPADADRFMAIAEKYNLKIICDAAQSTGARYKGSFAGTLCHVGGYSLNYHKQIHTGEGGIIVKNDGGIAERLQLIRNHAEAVVQHKGIDDISNLIGFNFRLGEIEAAIGLEQLRKLSELNLKRSCIAEKLTTGLSKLPGLKTPIVKEGCTHTYYVYPLVLDTKLLGITRKSVVRALIAEGVGGLMEGYANVHLLPVFQRKIAYGSKGFPWTSSLCKRDIDYSEGICPIAEKLHGEKFIGLEMCLYSYTDDDIDLVIRAFEKVWKGIEFGQLSNRC